MQDRDTDLHYFHLPSGSKPPIVERQPYRVVVLIEQEVTAEWQDMVSDWIIESGCLFMMAWGLNCSGWDDSVDWANRRAFEPEEIPDDDFVMTSWHDNEPMDEGFVFCRLCAFHPTIELPKVIILDITGNARSVEITNRFWNSLDGLDDGPSEPTLLTRLTGWFNRLIKPV